MTAGSCEADVLIVGGGPSGLATAIELRRRGVARVTVADRDEAMGGVPRYTHHTGYGLRDLRRLLSGPDYARRYAELAVSAGVRMLVGTTVTGWAGPTAVDVTSSAGIIRWRSRAVVLATGCRERPRSARLVPGDRPAGVMTTGSLQQYADLHGLPVGRRAVVVGAEHVSFSAVHTLQRHGVKVAAVVTDLPRPQSFLALQLATAGLHDVPVMTGTSVAAISGKGRVSSILLRRSDGTLHTLPCDTVVFTGDWIPDSELARHAGLPIDSGTRGPATDQLLRTPVPGLFAVGNLVHAGETADVAARTGRHAAAAIAAFADGAPWPGTAAIPVRVEPPLRWVFPTHLRAGSGAPPGQRLLLRIAESVTASLEVRQGDRVLYRHSRRRLMPNRSITLPARWIAGIEDGGGDLDIACGG